MAEPTAAQPEHDASRWAPTWTFLLLLIGGGAVANESLPLLAGRAAEASFDWGFWYVTMKFIVLPGASLVVLGALLIQVARRRIVPRSARAAGLVALVYLVALYLWPLPWFG